MIGRKVQTQPEGPFTVEKRVDIHGSNVPLTLVSLPREHGGPLRQNEALQCGIGPGGGPLTLSGSEVCFLENVSAGIDKLDRQGRIKRNEIPDYHDWVRGIERFGREEQRKELAKLLGGIKRLDELRRLEQNRSDERQQIIRDKAVALHASLEAFMGRVRREGISRMETQPKAQALATWLSQVPLSKSDLVQPNNVSSGHILRLFDEVSDEEIRMNLRIVSVILPALYGGVHLAAWHFDFPSKMEAYLWRLSGLVIMIGLPSWWVIQRPLAHSAFRAVFMVLVLSYGLARTYLIVESFVSLRDVPIGVYFTPAWIQMLPHL